METDRLLIRSLTTDDSPFIITLLNSEGWLRFIGDRKVRTTEDAVRYLTEGPLKSYQQNGFGLWHVSLKDNNTPIGLCGILKRDTLLFPDIGFAFLPQYAGNGFALESVRAAIEVAGKTYHLQRLEAITTPDNVRSQRLLMKCEFNYERLIVNPEGETLHLYSLNLSK